MRARPLILTTLAASMCTAHAVGAPVEIQNLTKFKSICFKSVELNVGFEEVHPLFVKDQALMNKVFALMKTKLTAYRIPIETNCSRPTAYLTMSAVAVDPISGVYSIAAGLTLDAYGLPGGFDGVTVWRGEYVLEYANSSLVQDGLLQRVGEFVDAFAADWAVAHP